MKKTFLLLAALGLLASVSAGTIEIFNDTGGWDIYYIYISSTYDDSWGSDWLGDSEILYSGNSIAFSVSNAVYDIKLIDEDGDEYIRLGVDVSGYYEWYVTLDDLGEYLATLGVLSAFAVFDVRPFAVSGHMGYSLN